MIDLSNLWRFDLTVGHSTDPRQGRIRHRVGELVRIQQARRSCVCPVIGMFCRSTASASGSRPTFPGWPELSIGEREGARRVSRAVRGSADWRGAMGLYAEPERPRGNSW